LINWLQLAIQLHCLQVKSLLDSIHLYLFVYEAKLLLFSVVVESDVAVGG
jgi:hypothetical protein